MNSVGSHKVGLVFGGMFAIIHAVWALMVFMGITKLYLDWIFGLHFLNIQYSINSFDFWKALILVVVFIHPFS